VYKELCHGGANLAKTSFPDLGKGEREWEEGEWKVRVKAVSISAGGGECARRDKILSVRVKRLGIGQAFQIFIQEET